MPFGDRERGHGVLVVFRGGRNEEPDEPKEEEDEKDTADMLFSDGWDVSLGSRHICGGKIYAGA